MGGWVRQQHPPAALHYITTLLYITTLHFRSHLIIKYSLRVGYLDLCVLCHLANMINIKQMFNKKLNQLNAHFKIDTLDQGLDETKR